MLHLLTFCSILFLSQASYSESPIHTIAVNGTAETSVDANLALIHLSLWGKSSVAKTAQDLQAKQYETLKSIVEKFKIKKEDFRTINYSFSPEYVYDQKTQNNKIVGYKVTHQISILLKNISDTGKFLDSLTLQTTSLTGSKEIANSAGVLIQSVGWDSDKKAEIEKATLSAAVQSAKSKAEALAKAAGVKIKAVHRMQHHSFLTPPPPGEMMEVRQFKAMASDSAATELSTGGVKVQVEVQMEFEI